jgi:hypothetical protein
MRDRGLRAILLVCDQADNKADAVLLDSYTFSTPKNKEKHNE